jgi:hypothetical protein
MLFEAISPDDNLNDNLRNLIRKTVCRSEKAVGMMENEIKLLESEI